MKRGNSMEKYKKVCWTQRREQTSREEILSVGESMYHQYLLLTEYSWWDPYSKRFLYAEDQWSTPRIERSKQRVRGVNLECVDEKKKDIKVYVIIYLGRLSSWIFPFSEVLHPTNNNRLYFLALFLTTSTPINICLHLLPALIIVKHLVTIQKHRLDFPLPDILSQCPSILWLQVRGLIVGMI